MTKNIVCLRAVLLIAAMTTATAVMKLIDLNGTLCEDGTTSGYYFQPSNDSAHAKKWLFWFEGDGANNHGSSHWPSVSPPISQNFGKGMCGWSCDHHLLDFCFRIWFRELEPSVLPYWGS
jgi:hypothetical protein